MVAAFTRAHKLLLKRCMPPGRAQVAAMLAAVAAGAAARKAGTAVQHLDLKGCSGLRDEHVLQVCRDFPALR